MGTKRVAQLKTDDKTAAEITRLTDAIWEYGQHRSGCRIDYGKECDCGFFNVLMSLRE